jgi:hypothetical protein
MINLNDLEEDVEYTIDDIGSKAVEHLRRQLYSIARKHNQTSLELENIKAWSGFYTKPFFFLLLPREIRDKIYTYTLLAPSLSTETTPRPSVILHIENYPFKPPTPGLLRANKKIYQEGIEILYSKNIFKFAHPREMFDFEGKIRASNRQLIRSICIWTRFPSHTEIVPSPEGVPVWEYEEYPSHWAKALQLSRFEKVTHLVVEGEMVGSAPTALLGMPVELQKSIEKMLSREKDLPFVPRLTMRGFGWNEHEKFPGGWEIVTDQWDSYKEEMRGMEEEFRDGLEYSDTEWAFDIGEVEGSDEES